MVCYYVVGLILMSSIPLAIIGFIILIILGLLFTCICSLAADIASRMRRQDIADRIRQFQEHLFEMVGQTEGSTDALFYISVPLIPLFIVIGLFLGTLVVVGQFSKEGPMEKVTAAFLLIDVLLKIGVTMVTEAIDYALHVRVRRVVSRRGVSRPRNSSAQVLDDPVSEFDGSSAEPQAQVVGLARDT
eukprot:gnl/MRDRNA2_/MRDRNA2_353773_c0_seq1.p1 gnl/MRDRNA2_/MRDRNA2_353773_c0~~gnl/MRDRNA2_/MRDRNA2_353773_c0_seq1.p1  ORF type:complete len:188 (+),score=15.77 gnl/MRDRNA2_/MRDRNA2_353773_c0_seq1:2-565(+)